MASQPPQRRTRRDATLKRLAREAQEDIYYRYYPADADAEKMSEGDLLAHISLSHGVVVSRSTLHEFLSWFGALLDGERMQERAEQAKLYFLKEYPDATTEELERWAQLKFYADQLGPERNGKLFAQMFKARTERDKLHAATRTKIQAGLEEMEREIRGNPKAMEIFRQLQEVLKKG